MLDTAILTVCGLAIAATTPEPNSIDRSGTPIFTSASPGVQLSRRPIGHGSIPDRAAVTVYDGTTLSDPQHFPPDTSLGFEDYGTTLSSSGPPTLAPGRHAMTALHTLTFVGSAGLDGGIVFFDFYQNDFSFVGSFGVQLPSAGNFIWTIGVNEPALVRIPTEGVLAARTNDDPDIGPTSEGQWTLVDAPPSPGFNDVNFGGGGGGVYYHAFAIEVEDSVPPCPPSGAPFTVKTYILSGAANNTPWAWRLAPDLGVSTWLEPGEGNVPGVPVGGAIDVAQAFADSINQYATLQGCAATSLEATVVACPGPPPACAAPDAQLRIRVGGGADFDLYVGDANADATTLVDVGVPVAFNPTIELGPPPPCVGDLDGDDDTDVFDFGIFATNFGAAVVFGTNGDIDGSGFVDIFDFAHFVTDFGCGP